MLSGKGKECHGKRRHGERRAGVGESGRTSGRKKAWMGVVKSRRRAWGRRGK